MAYCKPHVPRRMALWVPCKILHFCRKPVSPAGVFSLMGALSVRDGGDHRSKKFAPVEMPKAGHRFVADSSLEEEGFEPRSLSRNNRVG